VNILFVHEIDWLKKVVFEIHSLSELLSLFDHNVYVIDYESMWQKDNFFDFGSLKTKVIGNVHRAYPDASVSLRRPGFIKIPGLSRLSSFLPQYCEIRKTIKEKKIDVIVLYSVPTNGWQAVWLARKFGIPVVFRSIDVLNRMVTSPCLRPLTRFLEKRVYRRADRILALTLKMSHYVINFGADPQKVGLLLIPVDTQMFKPVPVPDTFWKKWGLSKKDAIILFIGTLFDFSGLDILVQHFREIVKEVPEAKLLIVGDGPQRTKLEKIVEDMGLRKRVIITGFQPYKEMPQYINMSSICVNPFLANDTTRDIFSSKIVQYLACGKAVMATRLPGLKSVIAGEDQGVIYVDSVQAMVKEVVSLLKSKERRQKLAKAGLNYAHKIHDAERVGRQLEEILKEVILKKKHE
jgi:glycosyltransferase involved in cell wall biosynthesis